MRTRELVHEGEVYCLAAPGFDPPAGFKAIPTTEPWMVYALPDVPTKAVPKPLDLKGGLQPITKLGSNGKVWQAALSNTKVDSSMIDRRFAFGDLGLNAFEACLVVNAIDSDGNDRTTYYAPGTGAIRFDSTQAVLGVFEALVWVELVGLPTARRTSISARSSTSTTEP